MRRYQKYLQVALLMIAAASAAEAQVETATAKLEGDFWASCAAILEIAIRRLDGVAGVSISMRTNLVEVTYKPDATFQPQGLREAAAQVGASVAQLQIVARGQVEADGAKRYFVAGKNRFLLTDTVSIPEGKPVSITGTVDDSVAPFKLKVLESRPSG